ncbi:GNAT family N-acetyltransferase [Dyadobacter fermentans]|uniref:GCN5-related N-acetyltransferase n=1 Tax=Dyadobacter fermentans (strain ATCC 700827 / DSM 18053 / CIP 107007 / KCTC 52180 / NS114) TaxID=471854 RepID=C6VVL3_DYAFD|nr:GNAT family N-acetyltransferase [Dyadobacter fermentans]ACT96743.1 GCN5-related N-acetyltransferase [Dyadobacter fermentans DSM 18053]
MKHILDNPVWNALRTHNYALGHVTGTSAFFAPEVAPFAAVEGAALAGLPELYEAIPFDNPVIFVSNEEVTIPRPWHLLAAVPGYQMIYKGPDFPHSDGAVSIPLGSDHVPEMIALTSLTNPGPFVTETIRFGHYEGIFDNARLVAMAGQRMHPEGFAEISAVCTHPDHLGKGYARHLLLRQVNRIQLNGEVPFLHVKSDNARAIGVYESLGFEKRTRIFFYVLKKNGGELKV